MQMSWGGFWAPCLVLQIVKENVLRNWNLKPGIKFFFTTFFARPSKWLY